MSDDRNNKAVSREFLAERDLRIFKMRQAGVSTTEIARRFGITSSVVNRAVQRQLSKLNSEALLAYPEVLRMELERLDNLQQAIWPMTQHRKVTMDDGTEVAVEPDLKAIQQVLSIMDRRSKLLGMEQNTVNVNMDVRDMNPIKATLAGEASTARALSDFDAEGEARQLLEIMGASGVLPSDTVRAILGQGEIVDAEVVETEQDE
jgi:DNA-binding CsgD family transcriptional regulator